MPEKNNLFVVRIPKVYMKTTLSDIQYQFSQSVKKGPASQWWTISRSENMLLDQNTQLSSVIIRTGIILTPI